MLTVYSLFLQKTDIALKRLQEVSYICGNIPRPCFLAAVSPNKVDQGKALIRSAIQEIQDLFAVVLHPQDSNKSQTIHRAFQVRPKSSENRFWESRVVEPVSAWALSEMLNELRKKSMGDAYKFYCTIKGPLNLLDSVDILLKFIFTDTWKIFSDFHYQVPR